jgi:hypothetical protein
LPDTPFVHWPDALRVMRSAYLQRTCSQGADLHFIAVCHPPDGAPRRQPWGVPGRTLHRVMSCREGSMRPKRIPMRPTQKLSTETPGAINRNPGGYQPKPRGLSTETLRVAPASPPGRQGLATVAPALCGALCGVQDDPFLLCEVRTQAVDPGPGCSLD